MKSIVGMHLDEKQDPKVLFHQQLKTLSEKTATHFLSIS
jgi:hypothetical protein